MRINHNLLHQVGTSRQVLLRVFLLQA